MSGEMDEIEGRIRSVLEQMTEPVFPSVKGGEMFRRVRPEGRAQGRKWHLGDGGEPPLCGARGVLDADGKREVSPFDQCRRCASMRKGAA